MSKPTPDTLLDYAYRVNIPTRWNDNDNYGHVNNAVYYEYFDTTVNRFLIENDLLNPDEGKTIGLVVETGCAYFAPISFPEVVVCGLRVAKVGTSSVRYEIGIFSQKQETACAQGHFVHVYVENRSRKPTPISAEMRTKLEEIVK